MRTLYLAGATLFAGCFANGALWGLTQLKTSEAAAQSASVSLPYCKPIQGQVRDLLGWSKTAKYKDECELNNLLKSGFVKIPDQEGFCTQAAGILISPSGQKVTFKNGCHRAALLSNGYKAPAKPDNSSGYKAPTKPDNSSGYK